MTVAKNIRPVLGGFGIASRALYLALTAQAAVALATLALYGAIS